MIGAELGKAIFALGVLILAGALALLPFLEHDSAEFVVTTLAAVAGGLILVLVVVGVRMQRH